jgi:undecaprenyl diphosphate synthase
VHVAIIMDGNGRWALRRGLPRTAGHRAGADAVDRTVAAAARGGITVLTLFALSCANWDRPRAEVRSLLGLLRRYLRSQTERCLEQSIRLNVIGRRDRLDRRLLSLIDHAEESTAHCRGMILRIAIDYSAQWSLMRACQAPPAVASVNRETFDRRLAAVNHSLPVGDVDLLIRTGGERRMSDFLLWECAYAELLFLSRLWPDFGGDDLASALIDYSRRERRFGLIGTRGGQVNGIEHA